MRPLDPALGLARIGTDDVDVQRVQRAAKLRHAITAQRALMIDAEHAVLVAVKSHRLAPSFEISPSGVEIGEGRLALDKLEVHQPTRRIVDEHEQRALRTAILKPPMLAAVDLHQFAQQSRRERG